MKVIWKWKKLDREPWTIQNAALHMKFSAQINEIKKHLYRNGIERIYNGILQQYKDVF